MDTAGEDASLAAPSAETTEKKNSFATFLLRCSAALLFSIIVLFSISFSIVVLAVLVGSFSIPSDAALPSKCKIVSSSVDIRSSKVCDLGLLNYNAKNVLISSDRRRFRCRHDYYWASIFKVEYRDHLSGQTRLALAEAPNEALPIDCRPSFSVAWLTKDKFKVNQTYDCWYTSGMARVSIYRDDLFSCHPKDPTMTENIGRYYDLLTEILRSWFTIRNRTKYWRWDAIAGIAGIVTGFSTTLLSVAFISLVQQIKSRSRLNRARVIPRAIDSNFLKRAAFLVVYVYLAGWLVTRYGKRVGIPIIYLHR